MKATAVERKRQPAGLKDKQGVLKTETQESVQRWVELLSEILNRDNPTNPVDEEGEINLRDGECRRSRIR